MTGWHLWGTSIVLLVIFCTFWFLAELSGRNRYGDYNLKCSYGFMVVCSYLGIIITIMSVLSLFVPFCQNVGRCYP
jgi:hypothetical protein